MCPWPGPAQRRGRGVSDGGLPPVGGRFRQPDRTRSFRPSASIHYGRTVTFQLPLRVFSPILTLQVYKTLQVLKKTWKSF